MPADFVQAAFDFSSVEPPPAAADERPKPAGFEPLEAVFPEIAGRTWLLKYEDEARRIALPLAFEKRDGIALAAGEVFLRFHFSGSGPVYARRDGRTLRFARRAFVTEGKGRRQVRRPGPLQEASWHLEEFPYRRPRAPHPRLQDAAVLLEEVADRLAALVGRAVCGGFYSRDPVLWQVSSLPFVLEEVRQEGGRVFLSGTNGAAVELTAVEGMRIQCYSAAAHIIIDAATEGMGYYASFHLTCRQGK